MRINLSIVAALAAFTCGGVAGMTLEEYKAGKARIEAEYQAHRQKCGPHQDNATDICVALARGARKAETAELQAEYDPGPRAYYNAAVARARADYEVAKQRCDYEKREDRKGCNARAKSVRDEAWAQAAAKLKATGN